jgi:hypothetical protein
MFRRCVSPFTFALVCSLFVSAADFPPGPMQEKVKAACTTCHAAAQVTKQHKSKAEWSKVLDKMVGYGAEVSDADRPAVLKYLASNFGPSKTAAGEKTAEKPAKAEAEPKAEPDPKAQPDPQK